MPTLLLLRHAKSSWDEPGLDDFDRPLTGRGRKAATRMGAEIAARSWVPTRALVSPAVRTRQTWKLVSAEFEPPVETDIDRRIYLAAPDTLLAILRGIEDAPEKVLLLGHNPGMEELAGLLAAPKSKKAALEAMREKFPTAALARLAFDGKWADLAPGKAQLTDFIRPKDLD